MTPSPLVDHLSTACDTQAVTIALADPLGVDTLRAVTPDPSDPDLFTSDVLAERWGISRQRLHQLRGESSPLQPPLAEGLRVGRQRGYGTMVWTAAQVAEFEAAHPDWVADAPARRLKEWPGGRPRRPADDD